MTKVFTLIVTCLTLIHFSFGQGTRYPIGGYKTKTEFKNSMPSISYAFHIIERDKDDILRYGGADYTIVSSDGNIKNKIIKKDLFAISTGETLFINCYLQKAQKGYAKVISEGKYIVFYGPINNADVNTQLSKGSNFGLIGVSIAGAKLGEMRDLYLLDTLFGVARPVNSFHIKDILEPYPNLLYQYQTEDNPNDNETLLKYIRLVNED